MSGQTQGGLPFDTSNAGGQMPAAVNNPIMAPGSDYLGTQPNNVVLSQGPTIQPSLPTIDVGQGGVPPGGMFGTGVQMANPMPYNQLPFGFGIPMGPPPTNPNPTAPPAGYTPPAPTQQPYLGIAQNAYGNQTPTGMSLGQQMSGMSPTTPVTGPIAPAPMGYGSTANNY